jgi:RNA polymerase sigma factor for flagellar operon FliA
MTARLDRDQLIASAMPLVRNMAKRCLGHLPPSIDYGDLVGAGALGLMDAVDRFDDAAGVTFTSFAYLRVRGAIIDSLRADALLPRTVFQELNALDETWSALAQEFEREPTRNETLACVGCTPQVRRRLDAAEQLAALCSLNAPILDSDGELAERLRCPSAGVVDAVLEAERHEVLRSAIAALPRRLSYLIEARYFEHRALGEIARDYGLSESRMSQMHTEALRSLRESLAGTVADPGAGA